MKNAIFCVAIGKKNKIYDLSLKTIRQYAERIGATLIVHTTPYFNVNWENTKEFEHIKQARYAWIEKLYAIKLLESYDRVLLMDMDILIVPNAPDIFAAYPDTNKTYVLFDTRYTQNPDYTKSDEIEKISRILGSLDHWPFHGRVKQYFNAGVILFSKNIDLMRNFSLDDIKKTFNHVALVEQTYLNYLFIKHNIPIGEYDLKYNWIPWLGDKRKRHQAYFIHHGSYGFGYKRKRDFKILQFINDYNRYYHPMYYYSIGFIVRHAITFRLRAKYKIRKIYLNLFSVHHLKRTP